MTTVVNLRHTDMADTNVRYIGRSHTSGVPDWPSNGWAGNPFDVRVHGHAALEKFRAYFLERVERDPTYRREILNLRGKRLACFCVRRDGSGDCHGKIIAAWIDAQPEAGS